MYLKVQYNNSIKNYSLTDSYNKPYIKVSNSILPLTTNTTNGIHLIVSTNNTTYRPLEYNSMSTSDTYYTSKVDSIGLSSTTELTRSSTSQTIYHTCSSTSGTSYLTRSSTSGTSYLTQYGTDITYLYILYSTWTLTYTGGRYITRAISETRTCVAKSTYAVTYPSTKTVSASVYTSIYRMNTSLSLYYYYLDGILTAYPPYQQSAYGGTYGGRTLSSLYSTWNSASYTSSTSVNLMFGTESSIGFTYTTTSTSYNNMVNTSWSASSSYYTYDGYYWYSSQYQYTQGYIVLTTGTSYLTRSSTSATSYLTRSSTSRTEYKTRESTSGYSGVSSSSSQSSGWL